MATIEEKLKIIKENLKTIKESTAAMKSVIETNGGDVSGDITTWANSIQTIVDNGGEGIIQTSLKYYDDGTHEVVPIKHPDLSTQPSILPYKFAGNYVYEQMVWLPRPEQEINGDNYQFTIETKIGETVGANLDNGDNALLLKCDCTAVYNDGAGHQHTSIIDDYKVYCFLDHCDIAFNDYSFYNDSDFKGCWLRLQYCLAPKDGGYYYTQEQDYIRFENNLQYAFIVKFNYSTSTSAFTVYGGGEFVLEEGMLDDFKNNTMYITIERKDSGAPNAVTLTDGNRKTLWYIGQPLFYSAASGGGLTLINLFDNVERSLITMIQE